VEKRSPGVERSYPMPSPRNTSVSATRAINVAIGLVEQQRERLRAIIESKQATPDEKFAALVDLAHWAGIVLLGAAEAGETLDKRQAKEGSGRRHTSYAPLTSTHCLA
jgi:hypothetical protein